ncbi:MAG: DNA-3-methyladenine glycosylase I [Candidatus Aminicenantes bacterium]|nr:DNA-3-methyladenine glycosylase I [Candidatus Aminicenantes bacterium]
MRIETAADDLARCRWAAGHPLLAEYHDREWGVPVHDDRKLFEFLVLDAFQAGLSWLTILKKRENFRTAFEGFDPQRICRYDERKIARLLQDPGIIRNRLKVEATVGNARSFLGVQEEFGAFDRYIWQFTGGRTRVNTFESQDRIPAKTRESEAMSRSLGKRGFRFVGPTICYAFMQAAGMVNDHVTGCFRYRQV